MKRKLRTLLDLLYPSVKQHVQAKQAEQQKYHKKAHTRTLKVEQLILVKVASWTSRQ